MGIEDVRTRWKSFLGKIQERHGAMLTEAEAGCLQLLDLAQLDTNPMANAWQGVSSQLLALNTKIQDTWDDKVESAFEEAYDEADSDEDYYDEFKAGEKLMAELEHAKTRGEAKIFGQAADKLMAAARQELGESVKCTQCKADLPIRDDVFRSYHIACQYCEAVNTFEPGTRIRAVEHFCSHHIAKRDTIDLEIAMNMQQEAVREARSASLDQLKALEKACSDYWNAFYQRRAEIAPVYMKDVDKDVDSKMRFFYIDMGREDNWQGDGVKARFNQEKIYRHIAKIGAGIAAAEEFPESIFTHFHRFFDEDAIKAWLGELWDESISASVNDYYKDDLALYRQLMPAPKNPLYDGFINEMKKSAEVVKRTKRRT